MDATKKERLLHLAEFLETLPAEKFDYARWMAEDHTETSCGSYGCALGWAASMPEFQKLGVGFMPVNKNKPLFDFSWKGVRASVTQVIAELFGTNSYDLFFPHDCDADCYDLFCPVVSGEALSAEASPSEVASQIRAFVDANDVEESHEI